MASSNSGSDMEVSEGMEMSCPVHGHGQAGNNDVSYPLPKYPTLPQAEYHDWRYKMRRTCQEIVPDLYLGKLYL